MTPLEHAEGLRERLLDQDRLLRALKSGDKDLLKREEVAEIERTILVAIEDARTISDIHVSDRAEQLSRELAALKVNYEEALTFRQAAIALGRERDTLRDLLAQKEAGEAEFVALRNHQMQAAYAREEAARASEKAMGEQLERYKKSIAITDRNVRKMQCVIDVARDINKRGMNGGDPTTQQWIALQNALAALSPAPAQPAAAKTKTKGKTGQQLPRCHNECTVEDGHHPDCSAGYPAAPPSPAAREATKEYDRCYSDLVQTINDVQTLAYENRKLAAATHRSGKVEPTEMSAKTMNVLDNAPLTNELCPCGDAACAAVDDSANHQCGGPAEACMIPGCKECGTPAVNSSNRDPKEKP